MSIRLVSACAIAVALVVAACGGGSSPTTAPATSGPATSAPATSAPATSAPSTDAPATADPAASLDPSQSDAGVAARVTITNDGRNGFDGTHDIYGVADEGSECDGAFEEPDFTVVAWNSDAPDGTIHRFGISVGADDVPATDGTTSDITDGGVSFDFATESGIGTTYTGASTRENEGSSNVDVTRSGSTLTFDFEGLTYDGVTFSGQFVCADA